VLEPAAWGVPVAFGPNWGNSRDAELLLRGGAAEALERGAGSRGDGVVLAERWERWIADASHRVAQGGRARAIVSDGLGAARRSAEMLAGLISSRSPRR
jgi:3-deoxy-D-manno-octulosonic-acid transferase